MDGFCIHALLREAQPRLAGARITRVMQPDRWSLLLGLQGERGSGDLLLSVKPGAPGVGLLAPRRDLPHHSSRFGDLAASRIKGALIETVEQLGLERIVAIHLKGGLLPEAAMTLYAEMLGPHGNIVLVDRAAGMIIDRLRSFSGARIRASGPGGPYGPPSDPGRTDPRVVEKDEFHRRIRPRLAEGIEPARALMSCFIGFGSLMAGEVVARSGLSPHTSPDDLTFALWKPFHDLIGRVIEGRFEPRLLVSADGQPIGVAAVPLITVPAERQIPYSTMSEAASAFFKDGGTVVAQEALRARLLRRLRGEVARAERLSSRLVEEAALYSQADLHGRKGQLLLSNRTTIRRGQRVVELPDYTDPAKGYLQIEIDPAFCIEDNAKRYFALQRKAKRGVELVRRRLDEAADRLVRLRGLMQETEAAKERGELERIESTLAPLARRLRVPDRAMRSARTSEGPEPRCFRSSDGLSILVGRSGPGNDHLTWRLARSHDLWLHAQGIPGSHVLVRLEKGKQPPPRTLREAAQIAAYYSRARGQVKVPVDYALRKYLRKPKAAAPGVVLVTQERTIIVRPDRELVRRLHAEEASQARES